MIASTAEFEVAVRNLHILEEALRALREQLEASNPKMSEVAAKAYVRRIADLQTDIAGFLAQHPADWGAPTCEHRLDGRGRP